jgi:ribosome modulation factor
MTAYDDGYQDGINGRDLNPDRCAHGTSRNNEYENGWADGIKLYEQQQQVTQ